MSEEIIVCEDHIRYCNTCKSFERGKLTMIRNIVADVWFWECGKCHQKIAY
jgi:hypothetical protein